MGVITLITGEAGSCSLNFPGGSGRTSGGNIPHLPHETLIAIIAIAAIGAIVLLLVHTYLVSVMRFALFDTVALERFALRRSWSTYSGQAMRFFGFSLLYMFIFLVIAGLGVAVIILSIGPRFNAGSVLAIIFVVLALLVLALIGAVIYVFVKDFTVPIMAMENVSMTEALGRVRRMINADMGSFAGYIGMKIVLAIPALIGVAILSTIFAVIIAIPVIIAVVAFVVAAPHAFENPLLIAVAVTLGVGFVFVISYVLAVITSPVVAFFESYALEFFGDRYEPLGSLLHPVVPSPAPAPATAPLPEPPPIPSPA